MKYEAITKVTRNKSIVLFHQEHPELSMQEIGKEFGISRQRVSVILKRASARLSFGGKL